MNMRLGAVYAALSSVFLAAGLAQAQASEDVRTAGEVTTVPGGNPARHWASPTSLLFDNGPLVTHVGGGAGGADASRLQNSSLAMTILGFTSSVAAGFRIADDFTVPAGGWTINAITFFAYQTGSTTTSTFDAARVQIWNGPPNAGGAVVFGDTTTNRLMSTAFSNIYRDSETTVGSNQRPIMATTATIGTTLTAGTYWVDFQLGGTLAPGPFVPPVTVTGSNSPCTPCNAIQWDGVSAWVALTDTASLAPQDVRFVIDGTVNSPPVPYVWTGLGADNLWSTPANWMPAGPPPPASDLVFPSGAMRLANQNDLGPSYVVRTLTFSGNGYQLTGSSIRLTLTLADGANPALSNMNQIDFPISLGAPAALTLANAGESLILNGSFDLQTFPLTAGGDGNVLFFGGTLSGSGGLVKNGQHDLHFNAANPAFTGPITVNAGILDFNSDLGLGSPSAGTTVSGAATLAFGGIPFVNSPEPLTLQAGATLSSSPANNQWTGPIIFAGAPGGIAHVVTILGGTLSINGLVTGPLTLGADASSMGGLGGRLLLSNTNNTHAGTSVASSVTLGGSGAAGAVQVAANGTVAPGASPGILRCGNTTFQAGSDLSVELNGTTPGSGYDQLDVTGGVTLTDANLTVAVGFTPTPGDSFTIINNDGGDAVVGTFTGLAEGAMLTVGNLVFTISYLGGTGNDVVLTLTGCVTDAADPAVTAPAAATVTQTLCQ